MGRTNLPPEKVLWKAIRTLLSGCIYGRKIDNEFDQRLLSSFLEKLFVPTSFEGNYNLFSGVMVNGLRQISRCRTGSEGTSFSPGWSSWKTKPALTCWVSQIMPRPGH